MNESINLKIYEDWVMLRCKVQYFRENLRQYNEQSSKPQSIPEEKEL